MSVVQAIGFECTRNAPQHILAKQCFDNTAHARIASVCWQARLASLYFMNPLLHLGG